MRKGKSIGVVIILLFSALTLFVPVKPVEADGSGNYPPPAIGDWTINTDTYVGNETIILTGNLTIQPSASLTLRNVTLKMNCTSDWQRHIEVFNGGTLKILDNDGSNATMADASVITSTNSNYEFNFWVRSTANFEMRNSILTECGEFAGGVPEWEGLYIQTDNATVDHCHINNCSSGVILYGSNAKVSNNTIEWNEHTGIYSGYWSNGTIENNWIDSNWVYGIWVTGGSNSDPKPSNPLILRNTIINTGRGVNTADGLQIEVSSAPIIKDTEVIASKEDGMYMWSLVDVVAENLTIDPQGGNYAIVGGGSWNRLSLTNSTVGQGAIKDVSIAQSYFTFTNTTFDPTGVRFDDSISNLTVNWYLHTFVKDNYGNPLPNVNIRIHDNANGTYDQNFTTDANGYVNWAVLKEFYQNQSRRIDYGPYNITVSRAGYETAYAEIWMNESKFITVSLAPILVPTQINLILKHGWNQISLPVQQPVLNGTPIIRASDLGNVTNCTMLSIWNASGQNYISYIPGFHNSTDPANFLIEENHALFAWWNETLDGVFNLTGYEPGQQNAHLLPGWNMISYNRLTVGDITEWAGQVSCGIYDDICYYDGQTFVHYIFEGTEMQLVPGRGYFVWSDIDTWLSY